MRGVDLQRGERPAVGCQFGLFKLIAALSSRGRATFCLPLLAAILLLFNNDARAAVSCTVTPTNLVFGDVTSAVLASAVSDTTGTISYSCAGAANNSTIRVCLELANYNGSTRSMTSGSNTLNYQIYKDAARTSVWGNSSDGNVATVDLVADGSGNASSSSTMYARVLTGQTTKITGSYSHSLAGGSDNRLTVASNTTNPCTSITSGSKNIAFTTTATISANCNVSTTVMNFGSASTTISSNIDSTATITAQCSNTTPYSIGLDNGTNVSGSQRRMRLGATGNYINYSLYTDAARSVSWLATTTTTSCTGGASTCALGTGTGANQNVIVYGRVPPQTAPAAGNFSDTVLITVTY